MSSRYAVFVALPVFLAAGFCFGATPCCNAEGIGVPGQAAADAPVHSVPGAEEPPLPQTPRSDATAQPAAASGEAAANADNPGDADGAVSVPHRHGLRWQSFLPGVIK